MKLKDQLSASERDELKNFMLHEPVAPGDTISHFTAHSLWKKGLAVREKDGWHPNWFLIQRGIVPL